MVKRIIVLVVLTFSLLVPCFAIGDPGSQELRFIYITNTIDTPTASLTKHLKQVYKDGINYGYPTIFYLSNMNSSVVATVGLGHDDSKAFGENQDLQNIKEIFDVVDFLNEDGTFKYQSMVWDFFINQSFWDLGYNDKIIAGICYILDIDSLPDGCFRMRIQYSGSGDLTYDIRKPLGTRLDCTKIGNFDLIKFE